MSNLITYCWIRSTKIDAKSRQCIFLRYKKGVKGFKLWDPMGNKVVISRDVIFDEKAMF